MTKKVFIMVQLLLSRCLKSGIAELIIAISLAAVLFPMTTAEAAASSAKNILILNSYHKGYSWTDNITDGITDKIEHSNVNSIVFTEYMDWKNYPSKENITLLYKYYKFKYSGKHIDLIIVSDDAALEFALKYRKELFSDAEIVFCGVDQPTSKRILSGNDNVTGIIERLDPEGTVKAALKMKPKTKNIYILSDSTESAMSSVEEAVRGIHSINPSINIQVNSSDDINGILQKVRKLPSDTVILLLTFYRDKNNEVMGFEKIRRLISENSSVPVFDLYDSGIGNGSVGGCVISSRIYGEETGELAVMVLEEGNTRTIPVIKGTSTQYRFDAVQLRRFGIPISRVPEGSTVINSTFSFFETYKALSITVIVIFMILISLIAFMADLLKKTTAMQKALKEKNDELSEAFISIRHSESIQRYQVRELKIAEQNLKNSELKYTVLFERMMNGFIEYEIIFDENDDPVDLRVMHANKGIENQVPLKVEDIMGKTWMDVYGYHNKNMEEFKEIARTGIPHKVETHYPEMGTWFLGNVFRIDDSHVGAVFDNITEYKNAIHEVKLLNTDLERRVAEKTEDLQDAMRALEAFTYTVSHDLKSPVRAIDSYSKIILEDYGDKLETDNVEMINNIRNICRLMIDMISQLLEYSKTSRMTIRKTHVNLSELIRNIFEGQYAACTHRKIEFIVDKSMPEVLADPILINLVISNLLENAIKFTKNCEKAIIEAGYKNYNGESIFWIKDNGAGFDMEYSGKLFGLFQRLHSGDEFEGNGVGLVTVRNIIQRHGGRVWLEGKVNAGATAYFTLPE